MKKLFSCLIAISFIFAEIGCTLKSADVATTYVSPSKFQGYDCEQMKQEYQKLSLQIEEISEKQNEAAEKEMAMFLLWGPVIFLGGNSGDRSSELGRLKGEYEALEYVVKESKCAEVVTTFDTARKKKDKINISQPGEQEKLPENSNQNRIKIAMLPWKPKNSSYFNIILDKINTKIVLNPEYYISSSYYNINNQIKKNILNDIKQSDLWKSNFNNSSLDITRAVEIGKNLDVDYLLFGDYRINDGDVSIYLDFINIYVVDVHQQSFKKFESNRKTNLYMGDYDTIHDVIDKAFNSLTSPS